MNETERWEYILKLDDELLVGGVILSEWSTFLIRNADLAYTAGAPLATLLTAMAGVESHLRYEYGTKKDRLVDLINNSPLQEDLAKDLHILRKYRNKWVHVNNPENDDHLLEKPEESEKEQDVIAKLAVKSLRRVIYLEQMI